MAKHKKLVRRERRKGAVTPKVTAAPVHRQPPARAHVMLEPTDPERAADAVAELARDDLAGVLGAGRWRGED